MLALIAFCVLCSVSQVQGNWQDGSNDPTITSLGFYVMNVTCNDAGTKCVQCFTATSDVGIFLHAFEYTEEPNKIQISQLEGDRAWKFSVVQMDKNEPFRACFGFDYTGIALVKRLTVCMDNDFSGVDVPAGCSRPIVVVSLEDHVSDQRVTGQQILYCAPPKM